MPRYFTKPRSWVADPLTDMDRPMDHVPTVSDHEVMDPGLVDANGDRIFRAPNRMGFVWGEEN